MARKTRTARRGVEPSLFLTSDGWKDFILDGDGPFDGPRSAAEGWESCRVATWRLWLAEGGSAWPPKGALAHDDIGGLAGLEDFRRRKPRTAAQIEDALEVYEAHMRRMLDEAGR